MTFPSEPKDYIGKALMTSAILTSLILPYLLGKMYIFG